MSATNVERGQTGKRLCRQRRVRNNHGVLVCQGLNVTTFDPNRHHLYLSSAGGKDLSNDTQITVIGLVEPEIFTEMLRNLSEKLRAKFPRLHVATSW